VELDDAAELNSGGVGESRRFTLPIDAVMARRFAYAAGDENPVYFDDESARRAGYDRAIAPPMFVCSMFDYAPGPPENQLKQDGVALGIFPSVVSPAAGLMGGGQQVEFLGPIYIGDTVEVTRTLVEHYRRPSKRFGELDFLVIQSLIVNAQGVLVMRILDTLIADQ
jgi:acyl dehydratase